MESVRAYRANLMRFDKDTLIVILFVAQGLSACWRFRIRNRIGLLFPEFISLAILSNWYFNFLLYVKKMCKRRYHFCAISKLWLITFRFLKKKNDAIRFISLKLWFSLSRKFLKLVLIDSTFNSKFLEKKTSLFIKILRSNSLHDFRWIDELFKFLCECSIAVH